MQLRWCTTHPWPLWSSSAYQGQVLHSGSATGGDLTLETLLFLQRFRMWWWFSRFCGRFKSDIPAITIDLPHIDPHVWSNFSLLVPWTILAGPWSTRPTWSSSSSIAAPTSRRRPWSTVDDRGRPLSLLMCVNQPHVLVESCWILIFGDDSLNNLRTVPSCTKLHQVAPSSWCTTCQSARCIFVNRSWIQP